MKRAAGIGTAITLMLSMCGCNGGDNKGNINETKINATKLTSDTKTENVTGAPMDEDFINATANFSVDIFKTSVMEEVSCGKNVLISPESIICALSMTANGANTDTLKEMEGVIAGGISIDKYNEYMLTYSNNLTDSKDVSFNMANSIWVKDDDEEIKVNDEFINICSDYYDADMFMAAFDDSTVRDINTWVNDNTDEMIPTLLNEIPEGVVMYLINAIAFEGEWATPYEEYQVNENGTFTNYAGEEEKVNMLNSTESIYLEDESATGFIKYYEGNEYAFMAILPKNEDGLDEYINNMTGESLMDLYNNKEYTSVTVSMPEFTYQYETELSPYLKAMGMNLAFCENADFSNMAETSTGELYINRVLHKTFIQVDRNGTEAAAVTAVEMKSESCAEVEESKEVILDRPFIYGVIDTETGLPIFMGVVNTID